MRGRKPNIETLTNGHHGIAGTAPEAPLYLDDLAAQEWRRLVPQLAELGILHKLDTNALAAYCTTFSRWRQAEDEVRKTGMVVRTTSGTAQINPYLSIARQAMKEMHVLMSEFGLSPVARHRLLANRPDGDPFGLT